MAWGQTGAQHYPNQSWNIVNWTWGTIFSKILINLKRLLVKCCSCVLVANFRMVIVFLHPFHNYNQSYSVLMDYVVINGVHTYLNHHCIILKNIMNMKKHFDELVQERRNSIANTLEFRLSCTNPLIWWNIECYFPMYGTNHMLWWGIGPLPYEIVFFPRLLIRNIFSKKYQFHVITTGKKHMENDTLLWINLLLQQNDIFFHSHFEHFHYLHHWQMNKVTQWAIS